MPFGVRRSAPARESKSHTRPIGSPPPRSLAGALLVRTEHPPYRAAPARSSFISGEKRCFRVEGVECCFQAEVLKCRPFGRDAINLQR